MKPKPTYCSQHCSYSEGVSFVPFDGLAKFTSTHKPKVKVLFILEAPGQTEADQHIPLVGATGQWIFGELFTSLGLTRDQVAIDNILRCRPPSNKYPLSNVRSQAEDACRHWDYPISVFPATAVVFTEHPANIFRQPYFKLLVKRALQKTKQLVANGEYVLVLMGLKALNVYFPEVAKSCTSAKLQCGHFYVRTHGLGKPRVGALEQIREFHEVGGA